MFHINIGSFTDTDIALTMTCGTITGSGGTLTSRYAAGVNVKTEI